MTEEWANDTRNRESNAGWNGDDVSNKDSDVSNNKDLDQEGALPKVPYPKSVFFIISNEFCERFSYYGMKTILTLYMLNVLLYSETTTKIMYHTFNMLCYFFPILGAIVSDSWLGKFNTIFYVSIIYAVGNILLALAATDPLQFPQAGISLLGLLLIAIGTGGIKPCVSAFGGDQFVLPQQEKQLASFFSLFYFSINAGGLLSSFFTPVLRENVHCFGNDTCYPVAFAVPGVLMIVSIIVFALGKPLYKIVKPEGNILVKVTSCMFYAAKKKWSSKSVKTDHWLDHSEDKYGKKLVQDIKVTLQVLVLYIPLPLYFTLSDQQGTAWTFQANRMNGNIGFYTILPDQMQVINPLLILGFIPLFTYVVYPAFGKCNLLKGQLQRMFVGGLLAAASFGLSACISLMLEATYPVLPGGGNGQIRIYNPSNTNLVFSCDTDITDLKNLNLEALGYKEFINVPIDNGTKEISCTINEMNNETKIPYKFNLTEGEAVGYSYRDYSFSLYNDTVNKPENGLPNVRVLMDKSELDEVTFSDGSQKFNIKLENAVSNLTEVSKPGRYKIKDLEIELKVELGGVYTILVSTDGKKITAAEIYTITKPNSVHMLLLLPQIIIITAAEIMFAITGLEFSYSQAPISMKSVLQAMFLLTTAFGNAIIIIIESAKIFDKQSYDSFLYSGLMVADMLLFGFMAMRYKYIDESTDNELDDSELPEKNEIDNSTFDKND